MFQFQHNASVQRKVLLALAAVGAALAWPMQDVSAQPAPNAVAQGKLVAQQYCVTCHIITPTGQGGWTDAPRFDAIANRPGVSAAQISTFVQKPHMNMLNDQRPKAEADAIAAYILSLRKH
ncbi:MAG: c-type cytochrome [Acetobacteraceae bacterium]|jgi:mono/diheme cytochrome c family protein